MWTVFTGLGYDNTNVQADYTYKYTTLVEDENIPGVYVPGEKEKHIKFDVKGDNDVRATVGFRFSALLAKFSVDYTICNYNVLNVGMGFSF